MKFKKNPPKDYSNEESRKETEEYLDDFEKRRTSEETRYYLSSKKKPSRNAPLQEREDYTIDEMTKNAPVPYE